MLSSTNLVSTVLLRTARAFSSLLGLGAITFALLAEPLSLGYRVTAEIGYDDNVLNVEGDRTGAADLVARVNPIAIVWKDGFVLQYQLRLKKNIRYRGEDTNHHMVVGQLKRRLGHNSSFFLAGNAQMKYTENTVFDNNLYSISSGLERHFTPSTSLTSRIGLGNQTYVDHRYLSWIGGTADVGLEQRLSGSLDVCVDCSVALKRYRRDAIVKGESSDWETRGAKQKDYTYSVCCRVEKLWTGLLGEVETQLVRNVSNSDPYSYWSTLFALSLVKTLSRKDMIEFYGSLLGKRYDMPWLEEEGEHPQLDPEEGREQTALTLRFVRDLTKDFSFSLYYRRLRREGRFPNRYYLKNDIGLGLSLKC